MTTPVPGKNPRRHVLPTSAARLASITPQPDVSPDSARNEPWLYPPYSRCLKFEGRPRSFAAHNANNRSPSRVREVKGTMPQPQPQDSSSNNIDNNTSGRETLKRHRDEVAGRVAIPEMWGQENFLKDWMDSSAFDALLAPTGVSSAREALIAEGRRRRAASQRLKMGSIGVN